jgi:poly-gamma-glutamate synthesis protein (capsule biosynthesis protein)
MNILITGDFCPSFGSNAYPAEKISPESIFTDFLPEIQKADFSIVNLECPLTESHTPIKKCGPNLRAGRLWADLLKDSGFDMVTLANNHIMDQGPQGLTDTFRECKRVGLDTVGAGDNLEEAQKTYYKEIKGTKLAIVNFAENEFASAEPDRPGAHPMNVVQNSRKIIKAKQEADFVLAIIHGGHEHCKYPSPRMVEQYRFYADMGADAVVAHHTHCIGGAEIYNDTPILYSMGNFFFPRETQFDGWFTGYAVQLNTGAKGTPISFELLPYSQCKTSEAVSLLEGRGREDVTAEIMNIGSQIQSGEACSEWQKFADSVQYSYLYSMSAVPRLLRAVFRRLGMQKLLLRNKPKMIKQLNMCKCEAHNDLLVRSFERYLR